MGIGPSWSMRSLNEFTVYLFYKPYFIRNMFQQLPEPFKNNRGK